MSSRHGSLVLVRRRLKPLGSGYIVPALKETMLFLISIAFPSKGRGKRSDAKAHEEPHLLSKHVVGSTCVSNDS